MLAKNRRFLVNLFIVEHPSEPVGRCMRFGICHPSLVVSLELHVLMCFRGSRDRIERYSVWVLMHLHISFPVLGLTLD